MKTVRPEVNWNEVIAGLTGEGSLMSFKRPRMSFFDPDPQNLSMFNPNLSNRNRARVLQVQGMKRSRTSRRIVQDKRRPKRLKIDQAMKPELTYFDLSQAITNDTTGQVTSICNVPNSVMERLKFKITGLYVHIHVDIVARNAQVQNTNKVMLILDRQPNGAVPAYDDIFTANNSVLSFPEVGGKQRFKILWEYCAPLNASGIATVLDRQWVDAFVKLPKDCLKMRYAGAATDEPQTNGLFTAFIGAGATGASGNSDTINIGTRLAFYDA